MNGTSTAFTPDADKLSQLTGNLGPTYYAPTYSATMSIDPEAGLYAQINLTGNATINAATVGRVGEQWQMELANDAGGARTVTWGTNLRPQSATVVGTASKSIIVDWTSNGTSWLETGRTTAV